MDPSQASAVLRRIAAGIDAAGAPDTVRVCRELGRVLTALDDDDDDDDKGSTDGPVETVTVNIPKKVDDLVKEVKKGNLGYTDAQAWGTAWSIYCRKNPGSPHCKQSDY